MVAVRSIIVIASDRDIADAKGKSPVAGLFAGHLVLS
jgi:hypothetical protein